MTDQQKIAAIIQAIQTDENLITVMRVGVTNNLQFVPSATLEALMQALNLPETTS